MTVCPKGKGVQVPCGAQVRAAIGLAPWAAQVPPTERAGSKGSYECCLRQRPFGGWCHHLSRWEACHWILRHRAGYLSEGAFMGRLGANVSGLAYSYAEYAPCGSLRIQFPYHPLKGALWVLGSDVNLSLWQQRRENHTTGLRPEENKQTSLRSRKCTPFGASAPPFPRRGNFALRSAFGPISISRHSAAKTSPSGVAKELDS